MKASFTIDLNGNETLNNARENSNQNAPRDPWAHVETDRDYDLVRNIELISSHNNEYNR